MFLPYSPSRYMYRKGHQRVKGKIKQSTKVNGRDKMLPVLLVFFAVAMVVADKPINTGQFIAQETLNGNTKEENVTAPVDSDDGNRQNMDTVELVEAGLMGALVGAGLGAAFGGSGGSGYNSNGYYPGYATGYNPYYPQYPHYPGQSGRPPYPDSYYPGPGPAYGDDVSGFASSYPSYYSHLYYVGNTSPQPASANSQVTENLDGSRSATAAANTGFAYQNERPFYYHQVPATVAEEDEFTSPVDDQVVYSYPIIFDDYTLY